MKLTPQQQRSVDRRDGPLFVHAGAGSGKTSVLVERFVRAALDNQAGVDSILAITFTEKAAAEMKLRIRARFAELGERTLARETERAWVSTIHGFCSRVLRAHPLPAGIDPEYRVLDEGEAARLALQASEQALEEFLASDDPDRLELVAAYNPDRLGGLVRHFHARRRSRGEAEPVLPVPSDDRDAREISCCRLLAELVERFGARYAALKRARSGLDFEDLELMTRDLMRDHPALRERYRARFNHVLVDELQDVNPLQEQLLELVCADNLFTVGDELQSIYGFRHADVSIFRRRRAAAADAGRIESLTTNFRSRAEILDVIDAAFSDVFEEGFQTLSPPDGSARDDAPRVELLLTERSPARWRDTLGADPFAAGDIPEWRAAEARLLAKRIEEIAAGDGRGYGDFVILLRASSDAPLFEGALRDRGIPTYLAGGGGYWGQQQVADVRAYLSALANPLDELALYSALVSPMGGASLDALVTLGLEARRRKSDLWTVMTGGDARGGGVAPGDAPGGDARGGDGPGGGDADGDGPLDRLDARDRARVDDLVGRIVRDRADATRIPLEDLLDRAVTESGYDRAVLAMPDGERRMANLRKLMRVARAFEDEEGRDLRGFIDHLDEQRLVKPREGEATLEGAELGAVRLMTIHNAKGLEFPVVCVADLGREGREDDALLDLSDDGRIALRMASLEDGLVDSRDRADLRAERLEADDAEERRVMYVALTRAEERLIVSGATDFEKWPEAKPLGMPVNWLWRALAPDLPDRLAAGEVRGTSTRSAEGSARHPARVAWTALAPATADLVLPEADRIRRPAPDTSDLQAAFAMPPHFDPVAAPAPLPVSRLSYSALSSYARCGYRFHLERVAGLRSLEEIVPGTDEVGDISALARGSVVHELLEHMDMTSDAVPADDLIAETITAHGGSPSDAAVADARRLLAGFANSSLRERLAQARRVRAEVPFAFNLTAAGGERSLLVNGYLDLLAQMDDGLLVVDYKTDALDGLTPAEMCDRRYGGQRTVYALAALRSGARQVEVAYSFLEQPDDVVSSLFTAADVPALERRLSGLAEGLLQGRFEPTATPGRELCGTCPGRPALCSWPEEATLA